MSKIDFNKAGIFLGFFVLLMLLVLIGIVLILTIVFWLPIVLVNIPFIIIFGILAKYTIVIIVFFILKSFKSRSASLSKQCITTYTTGSFTKARLLVVSYGSNYTIVYVGYSPKLVGR